MKLLCEICDKDILNNPPKYPVKESDLGNKFKSISFNNIMLDEVDKK